jgi:asparagine synthase (glutamine-hydrolysing)
MCLPSNDIWLIFNGEIYNHLELRQELAGLGHTFVSNSDTEVILAAYSEWGVDCQDRFNGMWAFALFDSVHSILFLSRDRFGVKPLYYWVTPSSKLVFASEIKAFTVLPEWKPVVNPQRLHDFLVWGNMDHTCETMFKNVFQIPGGHFIEYKLGDPLIAGIPMRTIQWYSLSNCESDENPEQGAEEFKNIFF